MGVGLVGGAAGTVLVASFSSVDQQVGTHGSAAAAVLGVGLIVAAFNPPGAIGWVRAGILYGPVVLVFEVISATHAKAFHLGPVIFGLAFSLLLIATYPERKKLLPTASVKKPEEEAPKAPTPEQEKPAEA